MIGNLPIEVIRKKIKPLYIRIYPPDARVIVSAPTAMKLETIQLTLDKRLAWINHKRDAIVARRPLPAKAALPQYLTGEEHPFLGQSYRLEIQQTGKSRHVSLTHQHLILHLKAGATREERAKTMTDWYRVQLQGLLDRLLDKWEPVIGVKTSECRIRQMKTRWGSCNTNARRIWLNLELVKKPIACIEYVLVHELVHLHERLHNQRFYSLMDHYYPGWRNVRNQLNQNG